MRPSRLVSPAVARSRARSTTWSASCSGARHCSVTSPGPLRVSVYPVPSRSTTGSSGSTVGSPTHNMRKSPLVVSDCVNASVLVQSLVGASHRPSNTSPVNASAGRRIATAPRITAGWRQPNLNEWMPSTNTDTAMPRQRARPSAARVRPASGAQHRRVGEEARRDPHHRPADQGQQPAARGPGQAIAGGDEQGYRRGHDQAPHHPARAGRAGVEPEDLGEVEVGSEREPEGGLVDAGVRVRERPREQQHHAPDGRDHRDAEAAQRHAAGARDRDREHEGRGGEHEQAEAGRVPGPEQRGEDGQPQDPALAGVVLRRRGGRCAAAGTAAARTAPADPGGPARSRCGPPG